MAELINKFNEGELTSSSIDRQFTPEFVTKGVIEMAPRKKFFSQLSNMADMPKNHGDKITKEIALPMLHKDNMVDAGIDASTAKLLTYSYYVYPSVGGIIDSEYHADDYMGANAGDLDTAIAAAKAAAVARVAALGGAAYYKSGAGNILYGDASFATSQGPLVELPEEGGVVNLLNSSSKLVSAKMTFHGIGSKYTVRSVNLDSRKSQVARKIKDLSQATYEIKEMQVQNSIISASESNRLIASTVAATPVQMKATDIVTYDALTSFEQELLRNDVPMDTEILSGTSKIDTRVVEDAYICFINRELIPGLRKVMGPDGATLAWIPKSAYAAGTKLLDGEAGSIGSFRFVVVPDLQAYRGAGSLVSADTTLTASDRANRHASGGYYDVFPMIVVGTDSFITAGFSEGSVTARHISPKADVYNDMHAQVGGVASNWDYGFLVYRPERIRQLAVLASKI